MRPVPFDLKGGAPEEYQALNIFSNQIRAERLPDDPPIPLDEEIRRLQSIPSFVEVHGWATWAAAGTRIVATGHVSFFHADSNQHMVEFEIAVLPEFRRRGLGRGLLAELTQVPRRGGRRLMITATSGNVPAGEAFMRRLGARMGLATHGNQLALDELDPGLLAAWQARAPERAAGFDLGVWTEGYPDNEIEGVAAMWESMNRAPRDDLDLEDYHLTPAHLREFQATDRARGRQRWTMFVRERATGRYAGMTEVTWHPSQPQIVQQQMTGVLGEYQGRGLGRWLKAAMLEKILRDRPEARVVRTGNADSNAPMLKINTELGFRPYESRYVWQVETAQVLAYLESAEAAV